MKEKKTIQCSLCGAMFCVPDEKEHGYCLECREKTKRKADMFFHMVDRADGEWDMDYDEKTHEFLRCYADNERESVGPDGTTYTILEGAYNDKKWSVCLWTFCDDEECFCPVCKCTGGDHMEDCSGVEE